MQHQLYASVDELLSPETLSILSGRAVKYVSCQPMPGGYSGSTLLAIQTDQGFNPPFVVKRMSTQQDWLMLASDDRCCRSVTLWQYNILNRLSPFVDHAIVACAKDNEGWAILMRNITSHLLDDDARTAAEIKTLLESLAAIHATYWNDPELMAPAIGLCDLAGMLRTLSVQNARRLSNTTHPAPEMILRGWALLQEWLAPDVLEVVDSLMTNPQPLCAALTRYPFTLVHGDYRSANLGLIKGPAPQTLVLDWQLSAYSVATIDLAFFLDKPHIQLSRFPRTAAIDYYRQCLARYLGAHFKAESWQPLVELGMLVNILRFATLKAWSATMNRNEAWRALDRASVSRYNEQVRAAVKWL